MQRTRGGADRRPHAGSARVGRQRQPKRAPLAAVRLKAEDTRRPPWTDHVRYWFDNTLTGGVAALIGWLAVACLAIVVPVSSVLVWTDDSAPHAPWAKAAAVWRTVGQTLRLGGEVGSPLRVALSVLLALVALFYVSTLVSLITTAITEELVALRLGHSTVLEQGHTVVLGWSAQIHTVAAELVAADTSGRQRAIAVLADLDKTEMEEELRAEVGETGRTRIICRNGRATDPVALARVSPGTADVVLVLPRDEPDEDAEVVKTLLALRALVGDDCSVRIVAVVRDERYRLAARLAAGANAVVLEIDDITARLVSQCVRQPGLSLVYQELFDFAGDEFHVIDARAQAGRTFGQVVLFHPTASVVGLVGADGAVRLNPARDSAVRPGDKLVVIARDDGAASATDVPAAFDESLIVSGPVTRSRPERLLLLGWNRRARRIVDHLSGHATAGTVLHVVTENADTARREVRRGAVEATGLQITFHRGDPALPETVNALFPAAYDGVIVLGPDHPAGTGSPDDRALVTLLLLRALGEGTGRPVSVVTEMTDDRNRSIAPAGPGADFVVSGKLIGLLMAQISQNSLLADVFESLLAPGGNGIHLRPSGDYIREGGHASFATVVESASRRGECAIGFRTRDPARDRGHRVHVNPSKATARRWGADDDVIVITAQ
ncbi:NAD-binding lipoprotein [Streptomyces sp. NBC_01341]|uniref:CASTOR/POLLUX-related putative ion channel n=1 Tax=Streptomyces sp. NBC_01341 TaxID=2903831 RepID=UPI002E0D66BF|nr:NAD-binding lipoprotein [Streptomyces sp. NBC_01341]